MRTRHLVIGSALTVAGLAIVAGIAAGSLPAGTQLPIHWGPGGEADRFTDADVALFTPVLLTMALSLLMAGLPLLEPLQQRLEQSATLYHTTWLGLLALVVLLEAVVAGPAFGWTPPVGTMLAGVGALFVMLGNVLPKSRPGFFLGIRTPWAIIDVDNWIATHRLGGRLMLAAGVALIGLAIAPLATETRASLVIAILLVMVTTPVCYSFLLWRKAQRA